MTAAIGLLFAPSRQRICCRRRDEHELQRDQQRREREQPIRTDCRFALELTGDHAAYRQTFRRLAAGNLSDLDPPELAYLLLFTHPTPQRLAAAVAE